MKLLKYSPSAFSLLFVFFSLLLLFGFNTHAATCNSSGIPPQQDASQQIYTGDPDEWGGDVSLWGPGSGIGGFDDYATWGDYVMYAGLDFGAGMDTVEVNVANDNAHTQKLELWIDGLPGQGQKIGEVLVEPTGGWGNYVTYTGTVDVCDVHNLYLIPVTNPNWEALGNVMWFRFSNDSNPPVEEYTLTVNNGSGDGNYTAGTSVAISADPAPTGQEFAQWIGDTAGIADVQASNTSLTMPAAATTVTATYRAIPSSTYPLRVKKGDGDGIYTAGTRVNISANPSAFGQQFNRWVGDIASIDNIHAANTRLTMPASSARIAATYKAVPPGSCQATKEPKRNAFRKTFTGNPDAWGGDVVRWGEGAGISSLDDYYTYGDYVMYAGVNFKTGASQVKVNVAAGNKHPQTLELWIDGLPDDRKRISNKVGKKIPVKIIKQTGTKIGEVTVRPTGGWDTYRTYTGNVDVCGVHDLYLIPATTHSKPLGNVLWFRFKRSGYPEYRLTVRQGSGDGRYTAGTEVAIEANTPSSGQQFVQWIGDIDGIADVYAPMTTFTMSAAAATVTATYEDISPSLYTLTVNNGSGSGSYPQGENIGISANTPPAGYVFDQWTGDTAHLVNANAAITTVTMPASPVSVTANYVQATYTLTVNNGSGSGNYSAGDDVDISANTPPAGQTFDQWTGDTSGLADIYAAHTTLTMPASSATVTATYELTNPSECEATGQPPQRSAFDQTYFGDPDDWGGDISLWGPGNGLGNFDDYYMWGDWVMFEGVDFSTGANEVTVSAALEYPQPDLSQALEMWVDGLPGTGTKIGEVGITPTGGWGIYMEHEGVVDVCSVHDLYFVGRAEDIYWGIGNLMWFTFRNTLTNLPPVASLSATPTSGQAPLVVEFDASASTDPDNHPLSARWDFAYDGTFDVQQDNGPLYLNAQGVFFKPGTHTAAVEISDPGGASSIDTVTIQVDGVDAGDKQSVLTGQSAIMQGLVSPSSNVTWSTVSGPGVASFANPNDLNTMVSFPAGSGHYVLKMTAHALNDSDTVQIEVVDEQPVIPIARRVDWSKAGVEGGIPDNIPVRIALTAGDLASDPVGTIQNAIDSATAPGVVLLPEGSYYLSSGSGQQVLRMRDGIVLRGRGMDKTELVFNAPNLHYRGAINIYGSIDVLEYGVNAGYAEGSQRLQMASVGNLAVGDTIWLYQDNDPVLMSTERSDTGVGWNADWAQQSMSQLSRIASISGHTIELDAPLRRSYSSTKNPRLVRVNTIKNVGIEDLAIYRENDGANGFNVGISSAENSWIRNVEFTNAKRAHVWMSVSRFLTLESNYGHDVLALGSGGNGYGFVTGKATSDTLIWNNVFERHGTALMVKEGSNGVVVAYNHVRDRYNPTQGTTDISLHGHYPYANLIEGNSINSTRATDWWGPGGNYITYFRNRINFAEGHGGSLGIGIGDRTHYANITGNSFPDGITGVSIEDDDLHRCHFTLVEGNLLNGTIEWNDLPSSPIPPSRFLLQPPHFWGNTPWPVVGADVDSTGAMQIPAEEWYQRILANGSGIPF